MLISTLAFTLLNASIKYLSVFTPYQLVFFRSIGSLFFTIPFLLKHKISMVGNNQKLLILRAIVGVTSMLFFFMSMKYLPLGSAVSLRYLAPLFAAFFAWVVLKEQIKPLQWLFFLIAFIGVLMMKGFNTQINLTGFIFILVSAIFSGLVFVLIRKIGTQDHPVVVVHYFMIIATLVGGVLSIANWRTPEGVQWAILSSLGLFGYIGQVYMTKAFQGAQTNMVAPLKYLEVIFTMLVGIIWFEDLYNFWSLFGILLVITGLVLNMKIKA
jgi:drug/metabolite transporter (DMT)-like permease